jgi:long-subunit fatty acid transport protein
MKLSTLAVSAAAIAVLLPAAAMAQTTGSANTGTSFYGTLGYADTDLDHVNLGSIQARLGARFGQYFGVEGELAGGVKSDTVNVAGTDVKVKLNSQEAIYGVGFLPLSPNFDLLARVGYGHSEGSGSVAGVSAIAKGDSWNYGVGGQYSFDGKNGVRADYTREQFQDHGGGDANVWSVAYVRKF